MRCYWLIRLESKRESWLKSLLIDSAFLNLVLESLPGAIGNAFIPGVSPPTTLSRSVPGACLSFKSDWPKITFYSNLPLSKSFLTSNKLLPLWWWLFLSWPFFPGLPEKSWLPWRMFVLSEYISVLRLVSSSFRRVVSLLERFGSSPCLLPERR